MARNGVDELRKQLLVLLGGGEAHMSFEEAMAEFPEQYINSHPPNVSYSPWQLLEHIRLTQRDILLFIRNHNYQAPKWPDGYWPKQEDQADLKKWRETIEGYKKDLRDLVTLIADPGTELFSTIPYKGKQLSVLREILVACDHTAYHLGEFAILRQVMGTWSKNRK
jgi:hypothetical protein